MVSGHQVNSILQSISRGSRTMNRKIQSAFLLLVIVQAIHSVEEFIFRFYERFPPMTFIYQNAPQLARPAFAISNALLFLIGLICFYYWVQPARKAANLVVWIWIILESSNVVAHIVWAVLIGGPHTRPRPRRSFFPTCSPLAPMTIRSA